MKVIKIKIKRLSLIKNTYLKSIILLISGAGFSQLIPVVFSPILGRIFSPQDFGVFAVFVAFCSILGMLSTGMYELSIMIPKKDICALNIMAWVVILSSMVSAFLFVLFFLFSYIPFIKQWEIYFKYYYLLPIGVLFVGSFQSYTYWLNRKKEYKILNFCRIGQSITIVVVSLVLGYLGYKDSGLILGFLAGGFITFIPLFITLFRLKSKINKEKIILNIKEYSNYPKLMLPTSIMNTTAGYVPVFSIDKFFNSNIVGSYAMASRILTAPVSIISVVIGQVYYKRLMIIINSNSNKSVLEEFLSTTRLLLGISILIFLPICFMGGNIVIFVFGPQWQQSGSFVELIAIATLVKFVVSPLSTIFLAINKLKIVAMWQTLYFCTTLCVFAICIYLGLPIDKLLIIYVCHECIMYLFYYLLMYKTAKECIK